ncbi:ATP-binding cassette domain-containing protein [Archaeoglobus neptunius]|uniref:ATP-binding cassette domain-containing protein n=1 Tax=Archaeoglobus neptunius TaxID=2798580 RepID=UPI001928D435|nr:ATP-binding cassette domain-containing protein [Archaeoglobus neptunius]
MIEFSVRSYTYPNGKLGLKDFRERFEGGEFIKGKTGSGKSTVLRMSNGLIPEFYGGMLEGRVRVFGEKPNPKSVYLLRQNPEEAITCLDILDEVAFPLIQQGVKAYEARSEAEQICEELGIGNLIGKNTFEISTGELQLVEIAAAIASNAKFLIFDEPFANISRKNALKVIRIIRNFRHIVSEHRIEFERYFDRSVDLGMEVKVIEIPEVEIGDTVYEGEINLRQGEVIALTGENGSGKTTMLKRIARDMRKRKMKFGIALQHPPYHLTESTVEEEVGSMEIIRDFELESILKRHPQSLSSGQMRRVAIAKAFKHPILLLDEPSAGQDVNFRRKLIYLLKKHGKSAVIATHDEELAGYCDRRIEL